MKSISGKPQIPAASVGKLCKKLYGQTPESLRELPGERDLNYLVAFESGESCVLKVANRDESSDFLEVQTRTLEHLATCDYVPSAWPTTDGKTLAWEKLNGQQYLIRALRFLPGTPLANLKEPSTRLLNDLGAKLAHLDQALEPIDHPILARSFSWNLCQGLQVVEEHTAAITDEGTKQLVQQGMARIAPALARDTPQLRMATIHNDANDYNVLVSELRDSDGERQVAGIIDFGDMARSYLAAEVAIASAYAACLRNRPLSAICDVVQGFHSVYPLLETELRCLGNLVMLRLCVSICMSATQQLARPNDPYLSISQEPILRTLPKLLAIDQHLVEAHLRYRCGFAPNPKARLVSLAIAEKELAPVLGKPLSRSRCQVMKLDVTAPAFTHQLQIDGAAFLQIDGEVGVGRYNEPRLIYTDPQFASADSEGVPESRTIHLGVDLFVPEGTPVFAPLDGRVAVCAIRDAPQDYGGLLVLRHEAADSDPYFTLYGHLSWDSVKRTRVGERIEAGSQLGFVGSPTENGGWPPHLHLQLITDLLGLADSFPGVAFPSERDIWTSFSLDPASLVTADIELRKAICCPTSRPASIARPHLGSSVRLSYRRPIHMARGSGTKLYDAEGRCYLDAYNNVPHVGHCHPRVVDAGARQMAILNTNTRYAQQIVQEYAGRLIETLPASLRVCFFLNSASEANELAIRLARVATRRSGFVVQDASYHGHTNTLVDVSPYKHNGPGGEGPPAWVHTVPLPDPYRGTYRGPGSGQAYADEVIGRIDQAQSSPHPPAAFLAETFPSVGGQIVPPDGYLGAVYDAIRAAGGLAIADEVQTGFGRTGDNFWAFQIYGVTPDIVVMGKPMGNGHPLAAVVTTREIAAAFDNGMEFFSTFGGNSVSCAIGLAVLDVLEEEQLPQHAAAMGRLLRQSFCDLAKRHPIIGDVRGHGLFWGLDLVKDAETQAPATAEAGLIVNRLRDRGILIGSDGIFDNVLKIRPPMPFDCDDANCLTAALDEVLQTEFP